MKAAALAAGTKPNLRVRVEFKGKPLGAFVLSHKETVNLAAHARLNKLSTLRMVERCIYFATHDNDCITAPDSRPAAKGGAR